MNDMDIVVTVRKDLEKIETILDALKLMAPSITAGKSTSDLIIRMTCRCEDFLDSAVIHLAEIGKVIVQDEEQSQ